MGTALVTLPDGRKARVSFDSEEQLHSAIAELEKPAVVQAGDTLRGIPRQVGLAGRYAIEGAAALPALLADIPAAAANKVLEAAGADYRFPAQGQAVSDALTAAGMPQPQDATERVVGDATRLLAGAGTAIKGAEVAARGASAAAGPILDAVSANPTAQAASAVGAGAAGGSVREAGGGLVEQFIAALLGGVAAPYAVGKLQEAAQAAGNTVRQMISPRDVAGEVKVALERAGVDWGALSDKARLSLVADAEKAVSSGQPLDADALRRLADYRNIGAKPLTGDITQDPGLITQQRNLAKTQANMSTKVGPDLPEIQNQNARAVIDTLDNAAPSAQDAYATGVAITSKVRGVDAALKAKENALYTSAKDAAGKEIPLARGEFVNRAMEDLNKELVEPFLPEGIRKVLNGISDGSVPFDVSSIDKLKRMLSAASQASDGNTRAAVRVVRQALDDVKPEALLPKTGATATPAQAAAMNAAADMPQEALNLLDRARRFAATRRNWQESLPFIEDALSGATPDKFVEKHIINGTVENLSGIKKMTGGSPALRDAIKTQLIAYIKQRGGMREDITTFTSKGLEDGLRQIGERKLALFFTKQEMSQIRSAVNVAKYSQAQPIGAAVNNSNTGAMVVSKVLDAILRKATFVPGAEALIGPPIRGASVSLQARQVQNIGDVLGIQSPRQPVTISPLVGLAGVPRRDEDKRH